MQIFRTALLLPQLIRKTYGDIDTETASPSSCTQIHNNMLTQVKQSDTK